MPWRPPRHLLRQDRAQPPGRPRKRTCPRQEAAPGSSSTTCSSAKPKPSPAGLLGSARPGQAELVGQSRRQRARRRSRARVSIAARNCSSRPTSSARQVPTYALREARRAGGRKATPWVRWSTSSPPRRGSSLKGALVSMPGPSVVRARARVYVFSHLPSAPPRMRSAGVDSSSLAPGRRHPTRRCRRSAPARPPRPRSARPWSGCPYMSLETEASGRLLPARIRRAIWRLRYSVAVMSACSAASCRLVAPLFSRPSRAAARPGMAARSTRPAAAPSPPTVAARSSAWSARRQPSSTLPEPVGSSGTPTSGEEHLVEIRAAG